MSNLTALLMTLLICLTTAFVVLEGLFMVLLAVPGSCFFEALTRLRQSAPPRVTTKHQGHEPPDGDDDFAARGTRRDA